MKDRMRAIILAAGRGQRLQQPEDQQLPKCLLRFGGKSLLERHLLALRECGVSEVVLALGFKRELIEAEIERMRVRLRPKS
jgi:choline kinase